MSTLLAELPGISEEQSRNLADLCRRYHVRRLGHFGSAADGRFDPASSDFDLTVEFDPPEGMGLAEQYFGLHEDLEELLGRKVDLVETSAVRDPRLLREIRANEALLYAT